MTISDFRLEHRFLSNFWLAEVEFEGHVYASVEHAYVAAKTTSPFLRSQIRNVYEPGKVKAFGHKLELRSDWEDVKLVVMDDLVRKKFAHPELRALLVATHPHELIESNTWGDRVWGVYRGVGENHLGRILMKVREECMGVKLAPDWD